MGWKCGPCTLPHGARHQCDSPVQPRGLTPLHLAAQHRHVDLARLLDEHGTDAGTQDKDGSTPVACGSVARTCGSRTPLHQAQRRRENAGQGLVDSVAFGAVDRKCGSRPHLLRERRQRCSPGRPRVYSVTLCVGGKKRGCRTRQTHRV